MKPHTIEEITAVLDVAGVDWDMVNKCKISGFSRVIEFVVDDNVYQIIWFKNVSKIRVGLGNMAPVYPFKYVFYDVTFPFVRGVDGISFSHNTDTTCGREHGSYDSFRIPIKRRQSSTPDRSNA